MCAWYTFIPAKPDEGICVVPLLPKMFNDMANLQQLTMRSSEQHRALAEETVKSKITGAYTPGLKNLLGLEDKQQNLFPDPSLPN